MSNAKASREEFNVFDIALEGSTLVEASAGTGKTWSSTGLYLRMIVEKDLLPKNILVVTFTKAATAELAGRIRARIQAMLNHVKTGSVSEDESFYRDMLAKWEGSFSNADIALRLQAAVSQFDEAAIYTIHSFCQRILNDYAFEASSRFCLEPITDDSGYVDLVAQDFWRRHLASLDVNNAVDKNWLTWLVDQGEDYRRWLADVTKHKSKSQYLTQVKPVEFDAEDLLAQESALLAEAQILWQQDSAIIVEQFTDALDNGFNGSTYRKADRGQYLDALHSVAAADRFKWNKYAEKCCPRNYKFKKGKDDLAPSHRFFELLDEALELFTKAEKYYVIKSQLLRAELLDELNERLPVIKGEHSVLGFDDILLNVYNALNSTQGSVLAKAVSDQFQCAVIDEFQDTDPLQLLIFKTLFVETATALFLVGDPKQAIYSFRGADIFAYYDAARLVDKQLTLVTNYRSSPVLVNSVNALFSTPHQAFVTNDIVYDWVNAVNPSQLVVEDNDDASLTFAIPQTEDGKPWTSGKATPISTAYTANKIAELLGKGQEGKAFIEKNGREQSPLKPGDIAVLVSSHFQASEVKAALDQLGIASVQKTQQSVSSSIASATLLRLMKAASEPANESHIAELLCDRLFDKDAATVAALKEQDEAWDKTIAQYWALRDIWEQQGFSAMFRSWLTTEDESGQTVPERLASYAEGERHLTDLLHLAEVLQSRSREESNIHALIAWLEHALDSGGEDDEMQLRLESDSERVKISTIHASKGLEYNIVFCPFLWSGRGEPKDKVIACHDKEGNALIDFGSDDYDTHKAKAFDETLMEQLRLLYVALTRPVHRCYVVWPQVNNKTGFSALAWLLYGDDSMTEAATNALAEKVKGLSPVAFVDGIKQLNVQASKRHPELESVPVSIGYETFSGDELDLQARLSFDDSTQESLSVATPLNRRLSLSWWQTSFSGLTQGQHADVAMPVELSEHCDDTASLDDIDNPLEEGDKQFTIFNLPRGAHTGNALHEIFEDWDFTATNTDALDALVLNKLNTYDVGKPEERQQWVNAVSDMVLTTLALPLDGAELVLNRLPAAQRQPEMEFLMAGNMQLKQVVAVLSDPQYGLPEPFVMASQQLDAKQLNGFLIGFIDLTFQDNQGRFHVLDWKSNHLGAQANDYQTASQEVAMAASHYYLQALIYLVALHRYLKLQLVNYDPDQHLGSAWYLFVRGITGQPGNGVYQLPANKRLINALDNALSARDNQKRELV
jgi:exodeoxyribonuclease V beta subunit